MRTPAVTDFPADEQADDFDELCGKLGIALDRAYETAAPVEYVNLLTHALAQMHAPMSKEVAVACARRALRRWRLWSGERYRARV
jgi:hypothetical protein